MMNNQIIFYRLNVNYQRLTNNWWLPQGKLIFKISLGNIKFNLKIHEIKIMVKIKYNLNFDDIENCFVCFLDLYFKSIQTLQMHGYIYVHYFLIHSKAESMHSNV